MRPWARYGAGTKIFKNRHGAGAESALIWRRKVVETGQALDRPNRQSPGQAGSHAEGEARQTKHEDTQVGSQNSYNPNV